jgi:hypothetical protein
MAANEEAHALQRFPNGRRGLLHRPPTNGLSNRLPVVSLGQWWTRLPPVGGVLWLIKDDWGQNQKREGGG